MPPFGESVGTDVNTSGPTEAVLVGQCTHVRRDSSVVDEDTDALLLGLDLLVHAGNVVLLRNVTGQRDDLPWDVLSVDFGDAV